MMLLVVPISWNQPVADGQYLEPCSEHCWVEFSLALMPASMPLPARQIHQNIWWPSTPASFSVSHTPGSMSQSPDNTKDVPELLVTKCYLDTGIESHKMEHLNSTEQ